MFFQCSQHRPFFSYVYWTVHHLDSWIKIDQLDVTCFIISLFTAQHVSNVSTSIFRSLRLVDLSHGLYCSGSMCVGVTVWYPYAGWGTSASPARWISRIQWQIKHWTQDWDWSETYQTYSQAIQLGVWCLAFSCRRTIIWWSNRGLLQKMNAIS